MRPTAAGLSDAAAHHQEIDDPPVIHVHVVPVVQSGTDDDHGAPTGLVGVLRKLAGHADYLVGRHGGNALLPGRGVGLVLFVARGSAGVLQTTVHPVMRPL